MFGRVLEWIYPSRCGLCGCFGPMPICGGCAAEFKRLGPLPVREPLDRVVAAFHYESRAAQAVRRLKYGRITPLANPLAAMLRTAFEDFVDSDYDCITPVPIHWSRRAHRGFNQSEVIATKLPKDLYRPELLKRIRMTRPQVGLSREERVSNLIGAFRALPEARSKAVLLVDDVTTSGHTAEQCAITLLEAGATKVGLLALTGEG